ncbi:hypothetical protein GCM10022409_03650 [Hymenobacter glaciei]|uniref:Uncharacterized protein n=1 Tax=Hymenobacter glaciei TaxID=877209 RepID=A0ABP7T9M4_9BACT
MKLFAALLLCFLVRIPASGQVCLGFGQDGKCNGLSLDGVSNGTRETNGLNLSAISESSSYNGLSIGLFAILRGTTNGLAFGLVADPEKANGVILGCFVGGLGYVGPTAGLTNTISGLSVGATTSAGALNGVAISMLTDVKKQRGVTIGGLNVTDELHGLQIGMLDYAGNNPLWLRYLPLLNIQF